MVSKRALAGPLLPFLAAASFVAIFFLQVSFPWIVLGGAAIGFAAERIGGRRYLGRAQPHGPNVPAAELQADGLPAGSLAYALRALLICGALWFLPLAVLALSRGRDDVYVQLGVFFSKVAVVTFGGADAVLSHVGQAAVETHGCLQPGEMLDGLGMAEATPGPLVQVVQFVGFLGAFRHPGDLDPLIAGIFASVLVTWVTFVPCFLFIFAGAPLIERLRAQRSLTAALSAITAAVVGVILNLALWFSLHTLFVTVQPVHVGPLRLLIPDWQTVDAFGVLLAVAAFVALFRFRLGILPTVFGGTGLGLVYYLVLIA